MYLKRGLAAVYIQNIRNMYPASRALLQLYDDSIWRRTLFIPQVYKDGSDKFEFQFFLFQITQRQDSIWIPFLAIVQTNGSETCGFWDRTIPSWLNQIYYDRMTLGHWSLLPTSSFSRAESRWDEDWRMKPGELIVSPKASILWGLKPQDSKKVSSSHSPIYTEIEDRTLLDQKIPSSHLVRNSPVCHEPEMLLVAKPSRRHTQGGGDEPGRTVWSIPTEASAYRHCYVGRPCIAEGAIAKHSNGMITSREEHISSLRSRGSFSLTCAR